MSYKVTSFTESVYINNFKYIFIISYLDNYASPIKEEIQKQFDTFGTNLGTNGVVIQPCDNSAQTTFDQIKAKEWDEITRKKFDEIYKTGHPFMLIINTDFAKFDPTTHPNRIIWFSGGEDIGSTFRGLEYMVKNGEDIFHNLKLSRTKTNAGNVIPNQVNEKYRVVITNVKGVRRELTRPQYESFIKEAENKHTFDMFIDGMKPNYPCYKKNAHGKIEENTLKHLEFAIIREYIETGKAMFPGDTQVVKQYREASKISKETMGGRLDKTTLSDESAKDYFQDARRKIDINLGRGKGFRAFKRGHEINMRTPSDTYQFIPPPDLKYVLICPVEPSNTPE